MYVVALASLIKDVFLAIEEILYRLLTASST